MTEPAALVRLDAVTKVFPARGGPVTAVDRVSLHIGTGETLGLVGGSGSGKSTIARLVLGLIRPTAGTVRYGGVPPARPGRSARRAVRRRTQMIFQNPYGSLLPHYSAAANVAEPLRLHGVRGRERRRAEALRMLDRVGIPAGAAGDYPHQFSGGQQQRIAIARALVLRPELLVCDEPTSALDASAQADILALLAELRTELGLACLFISHDLALVERMAGRMAVLHQGQVVETGLTEAILDGPRHPYTRSLLASALPVAVVGGNGGPG